MEYTNTEMDAAIADVIHSERDRRLMRRRMIDGIKFEPLAEEFDLSVRHTKTIVKSYRQAGLNVPDNLNDPNQIIQHLMNSGQISQQRYEQARQMAAQFRR